MGCDNHCVLPSCLFAFSAGISVYAYFWFMLGAWKLLKSGLECEDLLQRVFPSHPHTVFRKGSVELGRAETVETED